MTSNQITAEGVSTWSSEVFRIVLSRDVKWKSCKKNENLRSALCGISEFEENEKKCACFLYNCSKFFNHKHNFRTITPQSYNHTTFKPSYQNHTKINFSMILVWWFESWMIRFSIGGMVWLEWWDVWMSVFRSKLFNF